MAYAALMSLWHITDQILGFDDLDMRFFPFPMDAAESFQETIGSLLTFLDNCPPIRGQRVSDLITEIRDASYEVEDILESLIATHFLRKYDGNGRLKRVLDVGYEQIVEKLESINMEVSKIQLDGIGLHEQRTSTLAVSSRPALRDNVTIREALDKDMKMALLEQLVDDRSKLEFIPIVGMGGIGKTTLARILYDDKMIKETFDIRGWGTLSQTYNVQEIVKNILNDIKVPLSGNMDVELYLYQSLCGRRYLIVLDDVWDTQALDDIKKLFPDNKNGSRIIMTTRDANVAASFDSSSSYHHMQLLDLDSSWSLLCQEVFLHERCPSGLVEIGKEIARQCQGLPLAISAIGGLLKKEKYSEEYWTYVSENMISVLNTNNEQSLEILTLSYNYLPHHLKACFLYFGCFKEDHPIEAIVLVRMWVAEGFVKPSRSKTMEEVAKEYLDDIIERNLIFVVDLDKLRNMKTCGIHDLFRDICIREAKGEKFLCNLNMDIHLDLMEIYRQRRLALSQNNKERDICSGASIISFDSVWIHNQHNFKEGVISDYSGIFSRIDSVLTIRSLIFPRHYYFSSKTKLASGLLKVLVIPCMLPMSSLVEILELVNLKYLWLDCVSELPSSISRLRNLQTLVVSSFYVRDYLPSDIWEMPQLRHILAGNFYMPLIPVVQSKGTNTYILKNLLTLKSMPDSCCTKEVFTRIPNLKELYIFYAMPFYSSSNLVTLCKLESLRCVYEEAPKYNILCNNFFPVSLKKLVLRGCRIPWNNLTIIGTLPNLELLELKDKATVGNSWKTENGGFKQLRFLRIKVSDLVKWETEKDHFPSLKWLILESCSALKEIPYEIGESPTLEMIVLRRCLHELGSSAKEMLGEDSEIELITEEEGNIHMFGNNADTDYGSSSSTSTDNSYTTAKDLSEAIEQIII